jgi:malate/lactate dehydrogenase
MGAVMSVFIVTVQYPGRSVQDTKRYPTRRAAAHAAAVLATSLRPDGEQPIAVGIVVESEGGPPSAS